MSSMIDLSPSVAARSAARNPPRFLALVAEGADDQADPLADLRHHRLTYGSKAAATFHSRGFAECALRGAVNPI
jgi:hypothetical protein